MSPLRTALLAAGLAVSLGSVPSADLPAADVRTLDNGLASATVERAVQGRLAWFSIRQLSGPGGTVSLAHSPIWQADLRKLWPSTGGLMRQGPDALVPPSDSLVLGTFRLDSALVVWGACNDTLLTMVWRRIPVGHDTLRVKVRLVLPPGARGVDFQIEAHLSGSGQLAVHSLRFPVLVVAPFGDPEDDRLAYPYYGGRLLLNPYALSETWPDTTTSMLGTRWNYPAAMEEQFLYLYDGAAPHRGLYLASHDARGYLKRLVFAPVDGRLLLYLRHFNSADPDRALLPQFRSLSLHSDYGYACHVACLAGDWQTAADYYRHVMEHLPAARDLEQGFLRRGSLYTRRDMPRQVKEAVVVFQHRVSKYPRDVDVSDDPSDGVISDFERIVSIVDFVGAFAADFTFVHLVNNYLGGGEGDIPTSDRGLTGGSFRVNLPELLVKLKQQFGADRVLNGFNQDTGNWKYTFLDEMSRSIVKTERFAPFPRRYRDGRLDMSCTCQGSLDILARRFGYTQEVFRLSDFQGMAGFDVFVWSGQGSAAKACYAPADPETDPTCHRHPVGGGNFWAMRWRRAVCDALAQLRSERPNVQVSAERGHEQLIDTTVRSGHFKTYPHHDYPSLFQDELKYAQPIPLSDYLWHDLSPALGNEPSGYYPEDLMPNPPHFRLEQAQTFLAGRCLVEQVAAPGFSEYPNDMFGAPEERKPSCLLNLHYLRVLVTAKALFPQFLTYGRFLHFPEVASETISMPYRIGRGTQWLDIPRVWAAAFRAPEDWSDDSPGDAGAVGLVFTNFTTEEARFSFRVDFALPGLSRAVLIDTSGVRLYRDVPAPGAPLRLPPLSVLVAVYGGESCTGVVRRNAAPGALRLFQNYPNPFNPCTTITFELAEPQRVELALFDLRGRRLAMLLDEEMPAGLHRVVFQAGHLQSGVYLCRIRAGASVQVRKLVLVK